MMTSAESFLNMATFHVDRNVESGHGDRVAVFFNGKAYTYREMQGLINKAGNALAQIGVKLADRVMIGLVDRPESIAFFLGAIKIGAVPFMVSPAVPATLFKFYLNDSRAKGAVIQNTILPEYERAKPELNFLKDEIVLDGGKNEDTFLNASKELEAVNTHRDDVAYWVYSSGTTGEPKGIVHLHHDLEFSVTAYAKHVVNLTINDVLYSTSKMSFSYGRVNSMHLPLMAGASVVLDAERPIPERVLDIIEKYGITIFFSVPSFLNTLVRYMESNGARRFPELRLSVSAGEPLPGPIYRMWLDLVGTEILDGYGSSEAEYICISNRPKASKPDCQGKPVDGWEVKLVNEEGETVKEPGRSGVLHTKSDSIAAFYWHRHQESKRSFLGDWYNTKDIFYFDEDGYYHYVGRTDDLFKSKGIWVSPINVESKLLLTPYIAECAVVGEHDESGLASPVAYIVLKSGVKANDALKEEITLRARKELKSHEVPTQIHFVDEIPKTLTGKVQRFKLSRGKPSILK